MPGASIWVDADACPNVIKEILFRAAARTGICVTLVANRALQIPCIPSLRAVRVAAGFDAADGGPPPLTLANRNAFAAHLDTWIARRPGA